MCIISFAACGKSDVKQGKTNDKPIAAPWKLTDLKRLIATKVDGYDAVKGKVFVPTKGMLGPPNATVQFHKKRGSKPAIQVHVSAERCASVDRCKNTLNRLKKAKAGLLDKLFASEKHKKNPKLLWDMAEVTIAGKRRLSVHYRSYLTPDLYHRGLTVWMVNDNNFIELQVLENPSQLRPVGSAAELDASFPKAEMLTHAAAVLTALTPFMHKK